MERKQNEELDLSSPHFNALKTLYAPEESVRIPRPNAPILDNLSWFVETEDGIFPRKRTVNTVIIETKIILTSFCCTSGINYSTVLKCLYSYEN